MREKRQGVLCADERVLGKNDKDRRITKGGGGPSELDIVKGDVGAEFLEGEGGAG